MIGTAHPLAFIWLVHRRIPDVLEIDAGSVANPITEEQLLKALRCQNTVGIGMWLRDPNPAMVGYGLYQYGPRRIELTRLVIARGYRRRGYGAAFIDHLKDQVVRSASKDRLEARVADTELGAHLFLRACGMKAEAVERAEDGTPDTYRFVWRVGNPGELLSRSEGSSL